MLRGLHPKAGHIIDFGRPQFFIGLPGSSETSRAGGTPDIVDALLATREPDNPVRCPEPPARMTAAQATRASSPLHRRNAASNQTLRRSGPVGASG